MDTIQLGENVKSMPQPFETWNPIVIYIHYRPRIAVAILDL